LRRAWPRFEHSLIKGSAGIAPNSSSFGIALRGLSVSWVAAPIMFGLLYSIHAERKHFMHAKANAEGSEVLRGIREDIELATAWLYCFSYRKHKLLDDMRVPS